LNAIKDQQATQYEAFRAQFESSPIALAPSDTYLAAESEPDDDEPAVRAGPTFAVLLTWTTSPPAVASARHSCSVPV
jgi:hypothetical protein